jgi:tetratricopeptide (TPR) repeat protein
MELLPQNMLDLAEKLFRETLQLLEEIGDKARIAWTLHDLGTVFYLRKDYKQSEALNQKSIEIARSKNDQRGISLGLGMIGVIRMKQGKYAEAESLLLESYEICQKLKDKHGMETVLKNLMIVYSSTHNFKKLYRTMALLKSL